MHLFKNAKTPLLVCCLFFLVFGRETCDAKDEVCSEETELKPETESLSTQTRRAVFSADHLQQYQRDGFVVVKGMFTPEEMDVASDAFASDPDFQPDGPNQISLNNEENGETLLYLWSNPTGTFGHITQNERVLDGVRQIFGKEPVHYHSKLLLKGPKSGGLWTWHQDYGYWYNDYFMTPEMMTVYVAIDPQDAENGSISVLAGSHKLGRMEHGAKGDQQGVDSERLQKAFDRYQEVRLHMEKGDVLFFDSLILHGSHPNWSDRRRLAFGSAFTAEDNIQYKDAYIPCVKVAPVPDNVLLDAGIDHGSESKLFLDASVGKETARKEDTSSYATSYTEEKLKRIPENIRHKVILPT